MMTKQTFYNLLFEEAEEATRVAKIYTKEMGPTNAEYRFHWGKAIALCEVLKTMQSQLKIKGKPLPINIDQPLF